ncbi:hypothetical protein BJ165DRAFT_130093 [Panaeolus papilionaceus]|nr:hypothetical protein BJ165DRAFT_130093 [Panaeolus papilionaceus]
MSTDISDIPVGNCTMRTGGPVGVKLSYIYLLSVMCAEAFHYLSNPESEVTFHGRSVSCIRVGTGPNSQVGPVSQRTYTSLLSVTVTESESCSKAIDKRHQPAHSGFVYKRTLLVANKTRDIGQCHVRELEAGLVPRTAAETRMRKLLLAFLHLNTS